MFWQEWQQGYEGVAKQIVNICFGILLAGRKFAH